MQVRAAGFGRRRSKSLTAENAEYAEESKINLHMLKSYPLRAKVLNHRHAGKHG
jgi:hypothetical protein